MARKEFLDQWKPRSGLHAPPQGWSLDVRFQVTSDSAATRNHVAEVYLSINASLTVEQRIAYPLLKDRSELMAAPSEIHQSHPEIVKRLKRIEGHLRSIVTMIEDGRPCLDIAQQLHAVEKAVGQAKKTLVHDHIDHCLDHAVSTDTRKSRRSVEQFKAISKYL